MRTSFYEEFYFFEEELKLNKSILLSMYGIRRNILYIHGMHWHWARPKHYTKKQKDVVMEVPKYHKNLM